jgi:hypothetical protein
MYHLMSLAKVRSCQSPYATCDERPAAYSTDNDTHRADSAVALENQTITRQWPTNFYVSPPSVLESEKNQTKVAEPDRRSVGGAKHKHSSNGSCHIVGAIPDLVPE